MALGWLWWRAWGCLGRRCTTALCVAGVELGDIQTIHLRFAWHFWHWVGSGGALGAVFVAGDAVALCVAGVALGDKHRPFAWQAWHLVTSTCIHLRFAWQAWHIWHWVGSFGALGAVLVAGDAAALCVAGVALGDKHRRFAWQAWHLVTSTCVLRGRRGTYGTGLALVARLGRFWSPVTPRHFACGRRGTYGAWLALVARLGLFWSPVTPRHFAWQALTW